MEPVTRVEVRGPDGEVLQRTVLRGREWSVGRAYDNVLILVDEYADAHHCVVTLGEDGRLTVRDLGTVNGTEVEGRTVLNDVTTVAAGVPVRVGRNTLTFVSAETPVGAALRLEPPPELRRTPWERLPAWLLALVAGGVMTASVWLTIYDRSDDLLLPGLVVIVAVMILVWTSGWALATRMASGRARFGSHLAFGSLFCIIAIPASSALGWLSFAANSTVVDVVVSWGLSGFLFLAVLLYGHIDIVSTRSRRAKAWIAGGVTAALMGSGLLLGQLADTAPLTVQRSLRQIQPMPTWLMRSGDPAGFLDDLDRLQELLEEDAAEALLERPYGE